MLRVPSVDIPNRHGAPFGLSPPRRRAPPVFAPSERRPLARRPPPNDGPRGGRAAARPAGATTQHHRDPPHAGARRRGDRTALHAPSTGVHWFVLVDRTRLHGGGLRGLQRALDGHLARLLLGAWQAGHRAAVPASRSARACRCDLRHRWNAELAVLPSVHAGGGSVDARRALVHPRGDARYARPRGSDRGERPRCRRTDQPRGRGDQDRRLLLALDLPVGDRPRERPRQATQQGHRVPRARPGQQPANAIRSPRARQARSRGRGRRQGHVPRQHEPRIAHADEWNHRNDGVDAWH